MRTDWNKMLKRAVLILITGMMVIGMFGCTKKYRVDYEGDRDFWEEAKDSYPAGTKVTVYCILQVSDADLEFFLDGEPLNARWKEGKGYQIQFVMPEHDVKITTEITNTMTYIPD